MKRASPSIDPFSGIRTDAMVNRLLGQRSCARGALYFRPLAAKTRVLMKRSGMENEFGEWVGSVRAKHKAKRNFMRRLGEIAGGAGQS